MQFTDENRQTVEYTQDIRFLKTQSGQFDIFQYNMSKVLFHVQSGDFFVDFKQKIFNIML